MISSTVAKLLIVDLVVFSTGFFIAGFLLHQFNVRDWNIDNSLFRIRKFEKQAFYEACFSNHDRQSQISTDELMKQAKETCRKELVHWINLFILPLFWIWNPFWIALGITIFGILTHVGNIFARRYDRLRLISMTS